MGQKRRFDLEIEEMIRDMHLHSYKDDCGFKETIEHSLPC
jgi:hypothetical protein